jgi:mannose-1-phosphate guanylyltransferase/mannose-6-phosphate isomerase
MIHPVILCGGSGTRLWPLSRKSYPKQFAALVNGESLFTLSARRFSGKDFCSPVVVTSSDFRFIVAEQLLAEGIDPGAILIEPESRNTAPAVLAAALTLVAKDPDAMMLVAPSDHVISDPEAFHAAVRCALPAATDGRLVTFGISPTHAETGYGWLKLGAAAGNEAVDLLQFVEKPNAARAEEMFAAGTYLWNAGIFLFKARTLIDAAKAHAPELLEPVGNAVRDAVVDLGFVRLEATSWRKAPDISVDYAIMERASNLSVVAYNSGWSDLGGWDAVGREMQANAQGVSMSGAVTAIDCTDTLMRSDSEGLELVGIGLHNLIVVAMNDAVLVADKDRAQDVKQAVSALKEKGARQSEAFARDHRPWGHYETLALDDRFQVKRIVVKPGAALSLQSHHHRSEHWIVVSGTARVTVNEDVKLLTENQSVYIPLGAVHRLENPGKMPMVLIEVQTGAYLEEDDIVRYEDVYARS